MTRAPLTYLSALTLIAVLSGGGATWLYVTGHDGAASAITGICGTAVGAIISMAHAQPTETHHDQTTT